MTLTTEQLSSKSPQEINAATADNLDRAATRYAQRIYWDKSFLSLANIDALDPGEQDRIFNELISACIVMIMLTCDAPDLRIRADMRAQIASLCDLLPAAHSRQLAELGIELQFQKQWEELITMRYDEYRRDKHDVRAANMQNESDGKGLGTDALAKIQVLVPIQTVAIGCHHHICRQMTDGRDDLFKLILKHLSEFYFDLRLTLEGRRPTLCTRARFALRRLLHPSKAR